MPPDASACTTKDRLVELASGPATPPVVDIVSTGSTEKNIDDKGIPVTSWNRSLVFEVLDGRVRPCSPAARRAVADLANRACWALEQTRDRAFRAGWVVGQLYPFSETVDTCGVRVHRADRHRADRRWSVRRQEPPERGGGDRPVVMTVC